jgi:site-specific recombinase XerD
MATLHKRKLRNGETVWVLTHGTGSERQRFVAGRTRQEAQEVLTQFKRQLALHGSAPEKTSLEAAIDEYGDYLKTNRRATTRTRYERVLKTFHVCFLTRFHPEVTTLRDIKPSHLEEYKRKRSEAEISDVPDPNRVAREQALRLQIGRVSSKDNPKERGRFGWLGHRGIASTVSPRTINYELRVLFTFFHWAVKRNLLFQNPSVHVEHFRLPKRAMPRFITSADLRKFFEACSDRDRRLFMSILLTGMRKGEAEHLTWEDVSFELGVVFIREKPDLKWQPKTNERIIPISPVLHDVLILQYAKRTTDRWVFGNETGNIDTHMLERLKKTCRRAGIKEATVHALRHSFGTHLRMAGVSLADIADLLGHQDLATTQIYAKVQQEHLRQVVSKLGALVELPERPGQLQLTGGQHGSMGTSHAERESSGIPGTTQEANSNEAAGSEGTGSPGKAG